MTRRAWCGLIAAGAAVAIALLAACAQPEATTAQRQRAAAAADVLVDHLRGVYSAAYLGDGKVSSQSEAASLTSALSGSTAATASVEAYLQRVLDGARNTGNGLGHTGIDSVTVERQGGVGIAPERRGVVTATVDVLITQHYGADDVDTVELIPHELLLDAANGRLIELIVHDQLPTD